MTERHTPKLTHRFEEALLYAAHVHGGQRRKGTAIPYISHLLAVAALVLESGGDEDEVIAALLHDAAEDQGGGARLEDIRDRFGGPVANIVEGCTGSGDRNRPYAERKQEYVAHVREASASVRRVVLADKVHNARCILADYRTEREDLWRRFDGSGEEVLAYYKALVDAFRDADDTAMAEELKRTVAELDLLTTQHHRRRDLPLAAQTHTVCHLYTKEHLAKDDLKFQDLERIISDDKFALISCRCLGCGQLYLRCFSEINFPGVDDYWSYYVPVSPEELEEVKRRPQLAPNLFGSREHILWMPDGEVFRTTELSGGLTNPVSWARYFLGSIPVDGTDSANLSTSIAPYWSGEAETWAYDDPAHGRRAEPFVGGTPEMIDRMLERAGLPRRRPFVAVFSAAPFPCHQYVPEWVEAQYEGNVYRWEGLSGWLCPALFDFFVRAPEKIYLQLRAKGA